VRAVCIAVVLLSLVLAGCAGGSSDSGGASANSGVATTASELRTVTIDASNGKKVKVRVEIADTEAKREKGLMYRTALGEDRGMLFVFDREQVLAFWMKNTLIPLSVAFMDSEGRIVDIQNMKPLDDEPPHYVSAEPSQFALEVNRGFFEEHGVKVGDSAELPA
jgi:uncharacterized protein